MNKNTKKIGWIGCGNMGRAMLGGILAAGAAAKEDLCASARSEATRAMLAETYGIATASNTDVAAASDVLFLTVKPQFYEEVIKEVRGSVKGGAVVITVAPGFSLERLSKLFRREDIHLVRTMPNTPALVGEGMTGVCPDGTLPEEEMADVLRLLESFGRAELVTEPMMDAVTAVSGSSPAYIFMAIEAMADGAVALGMPRDKAIRFAAQSVLGSARMVLETGQHPGQLKDMVCSPGGTTIEAVRVLEECGLRSALIEAEEACAEKCREMRS